MKKEPKDFFSNAHISGQTRDSDIKVFCFFSSEKKALLAMSLAQRVVICEIRLRSRLVPNLTWTKGGLKILIERSKTDADGEGAEMAIPRGRSEETCPVVALQSWLSAAEITAGPLFRKVNRGGKVEAARLTPDGVRQSLLKRANQAGIKGTLAEPISRHGLRAGFVTTACRNGVPDEEIMGHILPATPDSSSDSVKDTTPMALHVIVLGPLAFLSVPKHV